MSDTDQLTITVTSVNDAPTATDATGAGPADDIGSAPLTGDDVDSDDDPSSLVWSVTTDPDTGSAAIGPFATALYAPEGDHDDLLAGVTREVTFGVTAIDSNVASSPEVTVTITVTNVTIGGIVTFQIQDDPLDPGDDGGEGSISRRNGRTSDVS